MMLLGCPPRAHASYAQKGSERLFRERGLPLAIRSNSLQQQDRFDSFLHWPETDIGGVEAIHFKSVRTRSAMSASFSRGGTPVGRRVSIT
jgi:hypothetical protein